MQYWIFKKSSKKKKKKENIIIPNKIIINIYIYKYKDFLT